MRDHFLNILGLDSSATDNEIKSAYRRLSKKYHPDINNSPGAEEKFIEIKNAYEYLMKPKLDEILEPYHTEDSSEVDSWRAEARKQARKRAMEKEKQLQETIIKFVGILKPFVLAVFIFNVILFLDYLLPYKTHDQNIKGVYQVYENSKSGARGRSVYRYDGMEFDDFRMTFEKGKVIHMGKYKKAEVLATSILDKPMTAIITVDGTPQAFHQVYNIYNIYGYIIPIMFLLTFLFVWLKNPMQKLNMAIVLSVFFIIQMVVFFFFS